MPFHCLSTLELMRRVFHNLANYSVKISSKFIKRAPCRQWNMIQFILWSINYYKRTQLAFMCVRGSEWEIPNPNANTRHSQWNCHNKWTAREATTLVDVILWTPMCNYTSFGLMNLFAVAPVRTATLNTRDCEGSAGETNHLHNISW